MSDPYKLSDRARKPLRGWLALVAAMIAGMVLVGGATRLTESGLSITEWKPVAGALPPLTEQAWRDAFEAYKTIPQYTQLNRGMTLHEYKTIFWWEWSHRLLGRAIGFVFLLPFLWFLWRGGLPGALKLRLWGIFALGGAQGAIGWWMVASGLAERTEVSQYRLAIHLIIAMLIFASVVWVWLRLSPTRRSASASPFAAVSSRVLVFAVLAQLYLGALVAGLRAGRIYNTWPLIDGALVPDAGRLFFTSPWWRNLFENTLTVQFNHRMIAYAIVVLVIAHGIATLRSGRNVMIGAAALFVVTLAQVALGVLTLLHEVPIDIALTHQAMAMLLLTLAQSQAERLTPWRQTHRAPVLAAA